MMGPVPEDQQDNPADNDHPNHSDMDELESPNHIIPPGDGSSTDDDDAAEIDSDAEGPAGSGYMLLPQDPEEEGDGDGSFHAHPFSVPTMPEGALPTEPMTEVRGAGVDLSQAVAEGNVHPQFAASFPDNKVPDLPKGKKEDVLWNKTLPASDRLQLDSGQLSKVKLAMAGFQLPKANIPEWAKHVPEDQWKQELVDRLTSPDSAATSRLGSQSGSKLSVARDSAHCESSKEQMGKNAEWPGTSAT